MVVCYVAAAARRAYVHENACEPYAIQWKRECILFGPTKCSQAKRHTQAIWEHRKLHRPTSVIREKGVNGNYTEDELKVISLLLLFIYWGSDMQSAWRINVDVSDDVDHHNLPRFVRFRPFFDSLWSFFFSLHLALPLTASWWYICLKMTTKKVEKYTSIKYLYVYNMYLQSPTINLMKNSRTKDGKKI